MEQKKKIIITTGIFPPDIGGPATYARTLATNLFKKNVEVNILSYSKSFRSPKTDKDLPFKIVRVWGRWPTWIKHLIFTIKLLGLARKSEAVFALNVWSAGLPSLIATRIYKKKFFIKIVGDYAWETAVAKNKTSLMIDDFQKFKKTGWAGVLYRLEGWICKHAQRVIVPSNYLSEIVSGWGVDPDKIRVIYNGVNFPKSDLSQAEARNSIGIHGNIILSVGRLMSWKGFRMLVKIMPRVLELSQFFRLVIVGDGPDRPILEKMINNLGLQRKVYLVGKKSQEDLAVYLAASDMFVLNSGYEGFSHQILEAMVAGVPVIAAASGGNREVIKQGDNGFLVKYNDEFNLVEAIKTLWRETDMKSEFIEEGKKTVSRFSEERMIRETLNTLEIN